LDASLLQKEFSESVAVQHLLLYAVLTFPGITDSRL
jgi:hypothetical protein